jgi:hypothetical protein
MLVIVRTYPYLSHLIPVHSSVMYVTLLVLCWGYLSVTFLHPVSGQIKEKQVPEPQVPPSLTAGDVDLGKAKDFS